MQSGGCGNNTADEPDPIDDFLNIVKTLKVEFDSEDLAMLQEAGLKLNIAIKVNDTFNVVWLSNSDYRETNTYQWSPIFKLFIGIPFKEGDQVEIDQLFIEVALGQGVTLEPTGELVVADDEAPADSISFINNSESPVSPGLAQQLTASTGLPQGILPTFVNPDSIEPEIIEATLFTPIDEVMVWFEDTETGTMFSGPRPNSVLVDLTNIDEITVSFSNGEWSIE